MVNRTNSSLPNRGSFSYLKFTKYVTNIISEPKYKYGQQEQVTVRNHNRSSPWTVSKSTGIDGISPKMLRLASDVLLSSLLQIINISLHPHIFPDVLNFPIHKGGPSEDPSNYRLISILPIVSKVIENMSPSIYLPI